MKYSSLFWLFTEPYAKVYGTLEISDDGEAKFISKKPFSEGDRITEPNIYSEIEVSRYISVHNPYYREKTQRSECTLGAEMVFIGGRTIRKEKSLIIKKFYCELENAEEFFLESFGYRTPFIKELIFDSKQGWLAKIKFTFDKKCSLEISTVTPEKLRFYQNAAHKVCTFISLAVGDIVHTKGIKIVDLDNEVFDVYYKPSFISRKKNSKVSALFLYGRSLSEQFSKWCELCDSSEEILRLYFLPLLTELDQTTYFILRSQFLEAFHRKSTKNNKLVFQKRILSMLRNREYVRYIQKHTSHNKELKVLSEKIRDIRNYYTHYNEKDRYKKPDGTDLIFINIKMDLIAQLFLMDFLGFKVTDFYEINHKVISNKYNRQLDIKKYTKSKVAT
ncbi:TPA: HEPN domain-containing protein [Vibrio campbellii]|uniref:HEPN domain-containing protein n=2 Tax=Vibrio harveyi group TaxID=717610 RepID=UPI0039095940